MDTDRDAEQDGPRRLLVAMLHTLAGPTVLSHLHELAGEEPTEFHLMMPVLPPDYGLTWTEAQAREDASDRLAMMLEYMRRAGLTATGETRTEAPSEALQSVAGGQVGPFDGVVVVWRQKKHLLLFRMKGRRYEDALGVPVYGIRADPPTDHSNIEDPDELRRLFEDHARKEGWVVA